MSIRGADADFTLYEDEGDNYNYEKGAFSQIRFHWDDAARTLTIGERKGDYKGMLKKRNFRILVVNRQSLRVTKSRPNSVAPYVTTEKHKPSNCKNFQTTKRRTPLRFIIASVRLPFGPGTALNSILGNSKSSMEHIPPYRLYTSPPTQEFTKKFLHLSECVVRHS